MMTPEEVRAELNRRLDEAATRRRQWREALYTLDLESNSPYGCDNGIGHQRVNDAMILADGYLSEHPADDNELVTVEWIKRVIPEDPDHPKHGDAKHAGHSLGWIEWDSVLCVYVNGEGIYWQDMTRRRFRALAYGMDVPLKEKS